LGAIVLVIWIALSLALSFNYGGWPFSVSLDAIGMYNPNTGEKVLCRREPGAPSTAEETNLMKACIADHIRKGFVQHFGPKKSD
jgi:hypothetical protein